MVSCLAEVESRTEGSSFGSAVLNPPSTEVLLVGKRMQLASESPSFSPKWLQLLILVSQGILAAGGKRCVFSGAVSKQCISLQDN